MYVDSVVNYDLPTQPKDYIHRVFLPYAFNSQTPQSSCLRSEELPELAEQGTPSLLSLNMMWSSINESSNQLARSYLF